MSDEILDSVLSEETLSMLDKHGATIDKVDGVLGKLDSILSKPLIKDVFDLLKDKAMGEAEAAIDPWGMTIGEMTGAQQIAPQVTRPVQAPLEAPNVAPIPKSEIHQAMHDSIDQMSEEQIMEMIENESKSQSPDHQDTECDPEDNSDIGTEGSREEHPSGIDGETSKD